MPFLLTEWTTALIDLLPMHHAPYQHPKKKYCQLEKEGLAIVFAVKKFHQYLYGRKFTIVSDHQPLKYLFSEFRQVPVMASSRVKRWALTLSAYDYTIQHRSGKKLANADALS